MRDFWALLVALPLSLPALPGSHGTPEAPFRKAAELREPSAQVRRAALFPDGRVAYYWERTRPPTDQEKDRRAAWFDAEWERFRRQAEQEGIPQIERSSEQMARKLEEEAARQPPVARLVAPFLFATLRGLPAWLRWVLEFTLPVAFTCEIRVTDPKLAEREICIVRSDGTGLRRLTRPLRRDEDRYNHAAAPAISEEGSFIVYRAVPLPGTVRATFLLALLVWLEAAWSLCTAPLVELRVTGGIAGAEQRLVAFEDGLARVELAAGRTVHERLCARLQEDKLGEIRRTLEAAGFEYLQREYVPARPVYDGSAYSVTYRGATVRALDPLENAAPPSLRAVIRLLQGVLQSVRADGRRCGDFLPGR